jgi:hypothetical protein
MNKIMLFAATAAVSILAGGVATAAPTSSISGHLAKAPLPHEPGFKVLFAQQVDDGGAAVVSQKFEAEYASYDSQGADDFTVPKGSFWLVKEVDVTGQYFNGSGPASSENVSFFRANAKTSLPAKQVMMFAKVKGKDNGTGSFTIKLPSTLKLGAGHYFISIQANLAFSQGGEWGWENTTTAQQFGDAAAWRNPPGGFEVGCTKWGVETTCIPSGQGPDHLFSLLGTSK